MRLSSQGDGITLYVSELLRARKETERILRCTKIDWNMHCASRVQNFLYTYLLNMQSVMLCRMKLDANVTEHRNSDEKRGKIFSLFWFSSLKSEVVKEF